MNSALDIQHRVKLILLTAKLLNWQQLPIVDLSLRFQKPDGSLYRIYARKF